jgi:glutamate/aspartate transport system substrate-binding protein
VATLRPLALIALCWCAWAAQAQTSPTLNKLRNTQLITVGYRELSIPFSYLNERQQPIGYSVELCQRVVESLQRKLGLAQLRIKYVPVTSATRIPLVSNGSVDLECGITTNTVERQRTVAFSITTFVAEARLLFKRKNKIQDLEQLRGQGVVSTVGTTSMRNLNELNQTRQMNMAILAGRDDTDAFHMLDVDRVKAFLMDDVLLRSLVATAERPSDYDISQKAYSVEPYAIMLNKNDPLFKKAVDAALVELFQSGKQQAIYQRWFMQPIPPKGLNLQLPMSKALQHMRQQPSDSGDPADYQL